MDTDRAARRANKKRLRELYAAHPDDVRIFRSHDATELASCRAQST